MIFISEYLGTIIRIGAILVIGFPLIVFLSRAIKRVLNEQVSHHLGVLFSNITFYAGLVVLFITILNELNFQLSALLGAAGILGIAVGFAAQTSVSNIISGIFLLLERSFKIGDTIVHNGIVGVIESIDLLSVKLRTFDNQLVRIPNENIIKSTTTNRTFYPIRRFDLEARIPVNQPIQPVIELLQSVVTSQDAIEKKPAPLFAVSKVTPWYIVILVRAWTTPDEYYSVARRIIAQANEVAEKEKIKLAIEQK